MLFNAHYAQNYAGIMGASLSCNIRHITSVIPSISCNNSINNDSTVVDINQVYIHYASYIRTYIRILTEIINTYVRNCSHTYISEDKNNRKVFRS